MLQFESNKTFFTNQTFVRYSENSIMPTSCEVCNTLVKKRKSFVLDKDWTDGELNVAIKVCGDCYNECQLGKTKTGCKTVGNGIVQAESFAKIKERRKQKMIQELNRKKAANTYSLYLLSGKKDTSAFPKVPTNQVGK